MINSSETQMLTTEMKRAENIVFKCCQVIDQMAHNNDFDFDFDHHSLSYFMINYFQL